MPARQHAASVWIIPILNRKMATEAATDSANAQTSTLDKTGASKESRNARMGVVCRKTVCTANQIARFKITPTTAAVMADKAALSALLPRSFSTNGAPRKIHRKQGVK